MKKVAKPKTQKKKAVQKKSVLQWLKKILRKKKKRSLDVLKKKARLYLTSDQKDIFRVRLLPEKLKPDVIYIIAYEFGRTRKYPAPKKMGISAVYALLIYEDYGKKAFKAYFKELNGENTQA